MALPNFDEIDIQYLDLWFSNLVDAVNFNNGKIEDAVPALNMVLSNIDTAPIQYLIKSFTDLIKKLNDGFNEIDERLQRLEERAI